VRISFGTHAINSAPSSFLAAPGAKALGQRLAFFIALLRLAMRCHPRIFAAKGGSIARCPTHSRFFSGTPLYNGRKNAVSAAPPLGHKKHWRNSDRFGEKAA
jgi:hypothetical protein